MKLKNGVSWSDSTHRVCKDLKDPISGAKNPWRDEFDRSLYFENSRHLSVREQDVHQQRKKSTSSVLVQTTESLSEFGEITLVFVFLIIIIST